MIVDQGGRAEIGHGGRTVQLIVIVNTDEDDQALAIRVHDFIATTRGRPMTLARGEVMKHEEGVAIWETVFNQKRRS